jgi:2-polyprenyl-3-methyl-5-hydroxy-6-metoxy-1,4-benzoquinol methylase
MARACPLCGSESTAIVGQLTRRDLTTLWNRSLGIDPAAWIATPTIDSQHCEACDLRYVDDALAGPEEMYRLLEKLPWYYLENKPEFDIARRHLAGAERVLEVGAGAGAFGRLLAGQGSYVGLEFNSSAVEQAVASGLDVRRESLAEHLASEPGTYDAVVTFQVMEHVPAVGQFIRECRRCLRPGGRLIVSVPGHDGFMGSELNNILDLPPHHITQWSDRTMAAVASEFDFTLVALDHDDIAPSHRANYLHQKALDHLGFRRTDARPLRASGGFLAVDTVVSKAAGAWGRVRRPDLPRGFGHSVTACYEVPASS